MEANQDRSYLTCAEADGHIFRGLVERLFETIKGKQGPRYIQTNMEALVEKRFDNEVLAGVTPGDLWKGSSETNGMLPLQDWAFSTWHFGRLITVEDSAHKVWDLVSEVATRSEC